MKDKIIQYPHRFQLVAVAGQEGVYDFVPVPGTITEAGTLPNKANILSDAVAAKLGFTSTTGTVNAMLDEIYDILVDTPIDSFIAFCAMANSNALDGAFGKNNEDIILNIGNQLALYSWLSGDSKVSNTYTNLRACETLTNILNSTASKVEIAVSNFIWSLLYASAYAKAMLLNEITVSAVATINSYTTTQVIAITQTDINIGKIKFRGSLSRSQGSIAGSVSLNGVLITNLTNAVSEVVVNLASHNITVPGNYNLGIAITYGTTYACTLTGYILKLK